MDHHFDDQHAHIGNAIPDTVDIVLDPGHQFTRVVTVKEGRIQGLQMPEQIGTHTGADLIEGKFLDIHKDTTSHTHQQYTG